MYAILSYITFVIGKIANILNFQPFSDFPVTILELMCAAVFIKFVFKLIFGGFKEVDTSLNFSNGLFVSKSISNYDRKKQINNSYVPKHAYSPKHAEK